METLKIRNRKGNYKNKIMLFDSEAFEVFLTPKKIVYHIKNKDLLLKVFSNRWDAMLFKNEIIKMLKAGLKRKGVKYATLS